MALAFAPAAHAALPRRSSAFVGRSAGGGAGRCARRPRAATRAALDPGFLSDGLPALHAAGALLADAAAAVGSGAGEAVEAAGEAAKGGGWWNSFVGVVELALVSMHDALAKAGVPGAYGATIILFTVAIKAVTFPLNYKQMESTMKMQALSPRLKKLQTDYKDNPAVMNQMIAQLYKDEEINPLAGCLPVIIQIPVWIALYRTVLNLAEEDKLNESFLFLPSLQGPVAETGQKLSTWLFPLIDGAPPIGWHDALCYLVLPVVLVASQAYSQKLLQPPNQDPSAAQANAVLKFMPLLIGWFSLNVPSGLGVYWVTNNLVSTLQTLFIRSRFESDNPTLAANASGAAAVTDATVPNTTLPSASLDQAEGFDKPKPAATPSASKPKAAKVPSSKSGKGKRRKRR